MTPRATTTVAGLHRRWRAPLALATAIGLAVVVAGTGTAAARGWVVLNHGAPAATATADSKTNCLYPHNSIATLDQFGQLTGKTFNCALVYNTAAPDWATWVSPWFTHQANADLNWSAWVSAVPGRVLVISQPMRPAGAAPADWVEQGAAGAYDWYAIALAQNLVNAGLGNSIIRLGFEANGTWNVDSLGTTQAEWTAWSTYWGRIVTAMRLVPGSHFQFDWSVNAGYRAIPLAAYYPGDAFVDIVGVDAYDSSPAHLTYATADARWNAISNEPSGLAQVLAFSKAHGKPLSIPEWGLVAAGSWGGGDDPQYVDGIAAVVKSNVVSYQSYFMNTTGGVLLISQEPNSLARYQADFAP